MHQLDRHRAIRRRPHLAPRSGQGRGGARRQRRGAAGAERSNIVARATGGELGPLGVAARHARSPRRLRLLGRQEIGLLRRHRNRAGARPIEATSGTKAVDADQADMAYPFPGRLRSMIEQGSPARLRLRDGRLRRLRLRLPEGKAQGVPASRTSKARPSPRRRWVAGHCRPDDRAGRRRSHQGQVLRRRSTWGQTLAQGQATPRSPGRVCAPSGRQRSRFRLHPGQGVVEVPGQLVRHPAQRFRETRPSPTSTAATSGAGRWGWSSVTSTRSPRPRSP